MQVRREKLKNYQEKGLNPFGSKYERSHTAEQLIYKYDDLTKEELEEKEVVVTVAGRVMTKRGQGKVGFAHLQDASAQIQVYVREDAIGKEDYEVYRSVDIGDIIGVKGTMFKTNKIGRASCRERGW